MTTMICIFYNFGSLKFGSEITYPALWQYGLWSFQVGGTKLERFLHKNQHTQRKLLNFEFWINSAIAICQK